MGSTHRYSATLHWDGNRGTGTARYAGYGRDFRLQIDGKPGLAGSADPAFRGDAGRHNPEDLLLGAIASCHMLTYLALCAGRGVVVVAYEDTAEATLRVDADGGGRFDAVVLRPRVQVAPGTDVDLAAALHDRAHALCFIANACSVTITHAPEIIVAAEDGR